MSVSDKILGKNSENQEAEKFYDKIRTSIRDSVINNEDGPKPIERNTKQLKFREGVDEDRLYGKLTGQELEFILKSYTEQQNSSRKHESVICPQVQGGSYERLLHSKVGFYSTDSTDYLIQKLNINDVNRISFLGGLCNYDLYPSEDLQSLIKGDARTLVECNIDNAYRMLNDKNLRKEAYAFIQAALKLDPNNGDAHGCLGWYYSVNQEHDKAQDNFKKALMYKPRDEARIKKYWAEALHNYGTHLYYKKNYKSAAEYFERALKVEPTHGSAKLHLDMSRKNLDNKSYYSQHRQSYRR